jgi:transcriptional regulator with XRE-family HTH domain
MKHLGQNVARIRGMHRLTQKEIADKLKVTQPEYSRIEQKEQIDEDLLQRIATVLDVTPEIIKEFNDDGKVNIISSTLHDNAGSVNSFPVFNFNPIERIVELYERMLKEKDEIIEMYKKQQNAS